jgi:hypothetical protein
MDIKKGERLIFIQYLFVDTTVDIIFLTLKQISFYSDDIPLAPALPQRGRGRIAMILHYLP